MGDVGLAGRPQESNMSSLAYFVYPDQCEYVLQNRSPDAQDNRYGIAQSRFCAQRWTPSACVGYVTLNCNPEDIMMC